MKRVLYVATVDSHISAFHYPYIEEFKKRNYQVDVVTGTDDNLENIDNHYKISLYRSPYTPKNIKGIKELRTILKENNYDLVICNTPMGSVATRLAKTKKMNTKIIYLCHGFHFYKGSSIKSKLVFYPIEKILSKKTNKIITINNEDYIQAQKFQKNSYYMHGIGLKENKEKEQKNIEKDNKVLKKILDLKQNDIVLTFVGELNNNKNQIMLLETMKELQQEKKYNNIHLLLVGEDKLKGKLQRYTKKNNIKNIHFLGYRKDVNNILNITNIVVSSSIREGLPINILEALNKNIPVIAKKNRGTIDLIENNINGYLIENKYEMKDRIIKVLNKELNKEKQQKLNKEIINNYSILNTKEEFFEILKEDL